MSKTMLFMVDRGLTYPVILRPVMQLLDNSLNNENVRSFVMTAYIVNLTNLAAVANQINSLTAYFLSMMYTKLLPMNPAHPVMRYYFTEILSFIFLQIPQ